MLLTAIIFFLSKDTYSQTSSLVEYSSTTYDSLNADQRGIYDAITSDTQYIQTSYFIDIDSIENHQDSGRITLDLPWMTKTADLVARHVYETDSSFYWYGEVFIDTSSYDSTSEISTGYLSILKTGNRYKGSLSMEGEQFEIHHLGLEEHIATEFSPTESANDLTCNHDTTSNVDMSDYYDVRSGGYRNTNSCPVTVLALYTQRAQDAMGGQEATEDAIALGIFNSNISLLNSNVSPNEVRLELVDIEPFFDFEEDTTSTLEDEQQLLFDDLDNNNSDLTQLRDANDADIIVLFTDGNYPDGVGRAGNFSLTANRALAMVEVDWANIDFNTAHEIGHLFNCRHAIDQDDEGEFEHGYEFKTGGPFTNRKRDNHKTVMVQGIGSGEHIANFSNPNVLYQGKWAGDAEEADNARMINATGCDVSVFRDANNGDLEGFIEGPFAVCLNTDVDVKATVTGGASGQYQFAWRYSYDGLNYTNLGVNSDQVSIPGVYTTPTDPASYPIFIRLTVTDQNNDEIELYKDVEATNQNVGQNWYPCSHSKMAYSNTDIQEKALNSEMVTDQNIFLGNTTSESINEKDFHIYPNPTTGKLYINIGDNTQKNKGNSIKVINLHGKMIYEAFNFDNSNLKLNIASFPAGMYWLIINLNGERKIKKIVKQ